MNSEGLSRTSAVLTTVVVERSAVRLREPLANPQHGRTCRAESGIHAHWRDLRAYCTWLGEAGLLANPVKFIVPKILKLRLGRLRATTTVALLSRPTPLAERRQ